MKKLLAATILAASVASPAFAYDNPALVVGLGSHSTFDDPVIGAGVEYRFGDFQSIPGLSPMVGATADADGALYGYGGLLYDWNFYDKFFLVPSFAAGLYHEGDSVDLGGVVEFRSAIELDYAITPNTRFGIALSHKSNAGLYSDNPGTEEITALYSFQF